MAKKYIDAELLRKDIEKHIKEIKDAAVRFTPNLGFFDAKLSGIYDVMAIIDSPQQEQPESSNGKFVFPKFLYARTVDNKTIDVSYAPQSMDAVEYIKNDPTEHPEVDFKIEERKWVHDAVDNIFPEDGDFMSEVDFRKILKDTARYFYELGINARKEGNK